MIRVSISALVARAMLAWNFGCRTLAPLPMIGATPTRYRNRIPGKARPAGSKLARKAANGRVGISSPR